MAQNFTKYYKAQVTTAAHTLFTADTTDAIIGIRLTNITTSAVTVEVWIDVAAGGATADVVYIAKDLSIPPKSSVELIQGGAKIVIASSDLLRIESSAATSIAAYISVVDAISTPP
jgi:hypothetical protein